MLDHPQPQWGSQRNATQVRQVIADVVSGSEPEKEDPTQRVLKDEAVDGDKALIAPPPSKRSRTSASQRTGSGVNNKYINTDLPLGTTANNKWQRVFLSTLAHVVSTYENPWSIPDDVFLVILQKVWDMVYKLSVLHTVETGGPVHHISKQALTNWRAGFASAAVITVTSFFSDNRGI
ncbi:hypothetical protein JVU11DRAFT_9346 [Chiua virens]|nr:hypothetical protein JVU11DRAFT_9346 [Chiua virens]